MSSDKLDKLIKGLIEAQPHFDRLQTMESRVWQSINKRRADMPRNVIEGWLASLFVPEYRLASLSFRPDGRGFRRHFKRFQPAARQCGAGAQPARLFFKLWYNLHGYSCQERG
jgi:hypothetical protein